MSTATDFVDRVLRGLILDVGVPVVCNALEAEAPWLKLPVLNPVFRFCVNAFARRLYRAMDEQAVLQVIDLETNHELSEYENASTALKAALLKGTDDAALQAAKAEYKKRLGDLIRLRP
jgi:hypothetical protein